MPLIPGWEEVEEEGEEGEEEKEGEEEEKDEKEEEEIHKQICTQVNDGLKLAVSKAMWWTPLKRTALGDEQRLSIRNLSWNTPNLSNLGLDGNL